jgi:hypothetical protein
VDCLRIKSAIRLSELFMAKVVANLDNDWRLTGAEVELPSGDRRSVSGAVRLQRRLT